jgi:hypothetical protein
MTNEKETKDINTNPTNQAENIASSSNTSTTISELEKERKVAEFKVKYKEKYCDYCNAKIEGDE